MAYAREPRNVGASTPGRECALIRDSSNPSASCPECGAVLTVGWAAREREGEILEGALRCSSPACALEYPVLDGVPILTPNARAYVGAHLLSLVERDDLTPELEALLVECAGPGSSFEVARQYLSHYAWDHYAEFDPQEDAASRPASVVARPGAVARVLQASLELLGSGPFTGPWLDLGCSVGRVAFELAARFPGPVVGLDLNAAMVRLARRVRQTGSVGYPRRQLGLLYERRHFRVPFTRRAEVDFWVGDALQPPFGPEVFGGVVCLNLLDCVPSPLDLLRSIRRLLRPGGRFVIASPFDWSGGVGPPETWIGGHSPRSPHHGESAAVLRALLTPGAHPAAIDGFEIEGEIDAFDWQVRVHDRCVTQYQVHIVVGSRV